MHYYMVAAQSQPNYSCRFRRGFSAPQARTSQNEAEGSVQGGVQGSVRAIPRKQQVKHSQAVPVTRTYQRFHFLRLLLVQRPALDLRLRELLQPLQRQLWR